MTALEIAYEPVLNLELSKMLKCIISKLDKADLSISYTLYQTKYSKVIGFKLNYVGPIYWISCIWYYLLRR